MGVLRNPKDSMTSTWRGDRSKWEPKHYLLHFLDSFHDDGEDNFPIFQKSDAIPVLTHWSCHVWILYHAFWPMALQSIYWHFTQRNIHPVGAIALYYLAFTVNAMHLVRKLRDIALVTGFFDGDKHARDRVPDVGIDKTVTSVQMTVAARAVFAVLLSYRSNQAPSLSWWLPAELFLYSIVLDFWFYIYHRCCHEMDQLWRYHRTHHLTKHPIPLLSAYADSEQEILEIAIIPLLTYATLRLCGMPMGFYDWWVCHQYIMYAEILGHSGLRIWAIAPGISGTVLRMFGSELIIEDHDNHHRTGWRASCNYGKQTRLWDRLFGTCGKRIEAHDENVDFGRKINMPLY